MAVSYIALTFMIALTQFVVLKCIHIRHFHQTLVTK